MAATSPIALPLTNSPRHACSCPHSCGLKSVMATTLGKFETFTKFPELPLELRRKILRAAILEPYNDHQSIIELQIQNNTITPSRPDPRIFNLNRESRQESIFLLGESISLSGYDTAGATLYFNSKLDTLYLNNLLCRFGRHSYMFDPYLNFDEELIGKTTRALRVLSKSLSEIDRSKIQNLAMEVEASVYNPSWFKDLKFLERDLVRFLELDLVTIVLSFGHRPSNLLKNTTFVETLLGQVWRGSHKQFINTCATHAAQTVSKTFNSVKKDRSAWNIPSLRVVCWEEELENMIRKGFLSKD